MNNYYIANFKGDLAGHDLSLEQAIELLKLKRAEEPEDEWELMTDSEETSITELRANTLLSQKEFAEHFKIPVRTLQEWEQGRRKPPIYVIDMIKKIMELERLW